MEGLLLTLLVVVVMRKSVNLKKSGEGLGNKKLYAMGFDGACIGTLRKLTAEQVDEMVKILNELRNREKREH